MKILLITLSLMVFSINAQEVPLYEQITSNVPELNEKTEVYLGDRMLEQRTGDYRECIIHKKTYERKLSRGQGIWIAKADQPICKKDADSKYYFAITNQDQNSHEKSHIIAAKLKDRNNSYEIHFGTTNEPFTTPWFPRKLRFKNINKDDIEINDRWFIYQKDSFQQTIEYAGKSGNILKFVYSEFTQGLARDAFTREFQVDLNEGNVLAFKGALIEIENATNINIRYKVIRNFRD